MISAGTNYQIPRRGVVSFIFIHVVDINIARQRLPKGQFRNFAVFSCYAPAASVELFVGVHRLQMSMLMF